MKNRTRTRTLVVMAGLAVLITVAGLQAADAPAAKPDAAALMKQCVAREQQRNNTGKAAAEVTCKEQSEVQRDVERAPPAKTAPAGNDAVSSAGHSSHSGNSSSQSTAPPAR
jgi:hypothetical protein